MKSYVTILWPCVLITSAVTVIAIFTGGVTARLRYRQLERKDRT